MKTWRQALREGWMSGSVASLVSTAVVSCFGKRETDSAFAPSNATSQWIWGRKAWRQYAPSLHYTLPGYAIHHASSCFWAVLYEKWLGCDSSIKALRSPLTSGVVIASLAYFTDYKVIPKRFTPGYEKHVAKSSLFLTYAALGLTLGLQGLLKNKNNPRKH